MLDALTINKLYLRWKCPWGRHPAEQRALTLEMAQAILGAPSGTQIGSLFLVSGTWDDGAFEKPGVAEALGGGDMTEVMRVLGPRKTAVLCSDRSGVLHTRQWCEHDPEMGHWSRYERWTAEGRVAHGWIHSHSSCRRLTQSG